MSEDVWSAQGTTPDAIESALRNMLRERHAANQALAPARVLNLIVLVERPWKGEIANRLERVGRYHASRTILCTVEEGRKTIDATAVMTYDEPEHGIGVIHEQVEIDVGEIHLERLDAIVDPVIVPDLPTVLWSPHGRDEAVDHLRSMVDVMLLDTDDRFEPGDALERAAAELESAYVVDLAWLRTTPWRERLAASFDPPGRRRELTTISGIIIRHRPSSATTALLFAGWLCARLGLDARSLSPLAPHELRGDAQRGKGRVEIELAAVDQTAPGLSGVTVTCESGFTLSLDRARGGLCARERSREGGERTWQVMGASRGEGGILGEGVRQAHLRDPTYGPALREARKLCPA
ncbi:MAG: glucose-6-phosphate dehydrogenase assembly protein OpcA [Solirubrobacteraceae bacterium]